MTQILALRSYGDFVVLMHAIKQSKSNHNINIVISLHLKPLFDALNWTNMNECIHIEFIDFGIKRGLLSFFTNKYLFTKSSFEELITIKQFLKKRNIELNEQLYLERENRISFLQLFLGKKLLSIHQKGNVYDCVQEFFQCSCERLRNKPWNCYQKLQHFVIASKLNFKLHTLEQSYPQTPM